MAAKHFAAISHEKGALLTIEQRDTPEPGPNEILIEVKALAFNPVDYYQRDMGLPAVPTYPAVFGCDVAGVVAKLGSGIAETAPPTGSRVVAFASSFYKKGNPVYGAFQQFTVVRAEGVSVLPEKISFEQGASIPLAFMTALTAYTTVDIPLTTRYSTEERQAILIWGASSSVGTMAIQTAKTMGFTIYATASTKHHDYVRSLGADSVFDYKDSDVVTQIVEAVRHDGTRLQTVHCVVSGGLQPSLDVLRETKGNAAAVVAHSPVLPEDHPVLADTVIRFNMAPKDEEERNTHIADCFQGWLSEGLQKGYVVPSPPIEVVGEGLGSVNHALDTVRAGVSGKKIVITL